MKFPEHKNSLHLTHNEHRAYYENIKDFLESNDLGPDFESDEMYNKAIETDEIWVLQWYPDNATSFYRVAAPTLEDCLRLANEGKE